MNLSQLIKILFLLNITVVSAADGLINVSSNFSVELTANRIEKALVDKGIIIFNRIDHAKNAADIGLEMREAELIIFGNPKAGTLLMNCQQSIAIDLPLKALIWKDNENKVWISYNDLNYIQQRHHVENCDRVFKKISETIATIVELASGK